MKKALASSGVSKERHHRCYKLPATRVKSCSHVKALILLDIWKTGFCLINYPSQSMAKKTCQPFSWSKVPISINGVDKSRSPEPSKTSWGQPTLEGYSHYPKFDRGSPFFSSIEYIFASLFVHFLLLLVCSIFFLVERQTIQQGWRSTQQISGLWKPSAVQRLHPAKPTECFTSSKKPCPFAVKNNRDHM